MKKHKTYRINIMNFAGSRVNKLESQWIFLSCFICTFMCLIPGCAGNKINRKQDLLFTVPPDQFYYEKSIGGDSVKVPKQPWWTTASLSDTLFRGISANCSNENEAMEKAMDVAVSMIGQYLGAKVKGYKTTLRYEFNDSAISFSDEKIIFLYSALVRFVKDHQWYKECWKDESGKQYWKAYVLVVCPKSELIKAERLLNEYRTQSEKVERLLYQLNEMADKMGSQLSELTRQKSALDSLRAIGNMAFMNYNEHLNNEYFTSKHVKLQPALDLITLNAHYFAKTYDELMREERDLFLKMEKIQKRRNGFPAELVPYVARMNTANKLFAEVQDKIREIESDLMDLKNKAEKIRAQFKREKEILNDIKARIANELPLEVVPKY